MTGKDWTVYTTEDLAPWAVFVDGHVPLDLSGDAFDEAMVNILEDQGFEGDEARDAVRDARRGHFWIRQGYDDCGVEEIDEEYPWHWCEEGHKGARAITGLRFP